MHYQRCRLPLAIVAAAEGDRGIGTQQGESSDRHISRQAISQNSQNLFSSQEIIVTPASSARLHYGSKAPHLVREAALFAL
jgi:hypothetical protein